LYVGKFEELYKTNLTIKRGPRAAKTAEIFIIKFFFKLNVSESKREKKERGKS
jgi:hypothetical protein